MEPSLPTCRGRPAISASAHLVTRTTKAAARQPATRPSCRALPSCATPKWRDPLAGRDRGLLLRVVCPRQTRSDHEGGAKGGGHEPSANLPSPPFLSV